MDPEIAAFSNTIQYHTDKKAEAPERYPQITHILSDRGEICLQAIKPFS